MKYSIEQYNALFKIIIFTNEIAPSGLLLSTLFPVPNNERQLSKTDSISRNI